ncbi:hypothetical protein PV325_002444 [Microctonus aethiopoides]|nr:hypothetical protein PV325_002444 [Microctonus aethiopoides]
MTRIKYFLVALIVGHAISASLQCNYESCPNYWNPSTPFIHTMCAYPPNSYGAECQEVATSGLTNEEIEEVLGRHNELRAKVAAGEESRGLHGGQPGGNIRSLEWDNNLAVVAQRWANQCVFKHDKCRNIDGIEVGQNLGYRGTTGTLVDKFSDIVTGWYDEVKDFNHQYVSNYQSGPGGAVTTHYTQLIWANTTHVGCGGIKYKNSDFNKTHLVCNYRKKGNTIGEVVYEINDKTGRHPTSESDKRAPPSKHVNQFPKEYTEKFIDESDKRTPPSTHVIDRFSEDSSEEFIDEYDKMAPPFTHYNTFSKEPEREFSKELFEEPPSETIHNYPNILADLPDKNHVKKSPHEFNNEYYNQNTYQRPLLLANLPPNQNQFGYSKECAYNQCEDKRIRGTYNQHTMCQYSTPTVAATCGYHANPGLEIVEENQILDLHNEFKNKALQEIARLGIRRDNKPIGYAEPLKWNAKLAEVAQRWANQCIYNEDKCRNIDGFEVSQNVGQMSDEHEFRAKFSDIVIAWYFVRDNYDANRNKLQFNYDSEYYEHLVWAGTTDIGCGGINYVNPVTNFFTTYLVCNYMTAKDITRKPIQKPIGPVKPIRRPNYPPENNVPTQKPIRRTHYEPASAIENLAPKITVRVGGDDCQYQACADPKISGKYNMHTMCQYLSTDPAEECYDVKKSSLNNGEKNEIILIHNDLIRSANSNVQSIQWNDELEKIAQRWANQCRQEIDACKNMLDGSPVRQYFGFIKKEHTFHSDLSYFIKSWNRDAPFEDKIIEVGCGIVEYKEDGDVFNTFFVCNYKTPRVNNTQIIDSGLQSFGIEF